MTAGGDWDLIRLLGATASGLVCGTALLLQVLLRDAVEAGIPSATARQHRALLFLRLLAAGLTLGLLFLLLPRTAPENGGSELEFWTLVASVVVWVLIGLRKTRALAPKLRQAMINRLR
jgi:hypothetical protein